MAIILEISTIFAKNLLIVGIFKITAYMIGLKSNNK